MQITDEEFPATVQVNVTPKKRRIYFEPRAGHCCRWKVNIQLGIQLYLFATINCNHKTILSEVV